MKKYQLIPILIICFLLFGMIASANDIPAPFAKAKEMALKVPADSLGRYLLTFETQDTSYTFYIIGYLSQQMIIGVGKTIGGTLVVAEYYEKDGKFAFYVDGKGRYEAEKEKAINFAFQIFRELVERKLI